jgi:hypothetical protein
MEPQNLGRRGGLRQVRRLSNWTALALIASTAAATGYFARAGASHASPYRAAGQAGATGATPSGRHQACVTVPVATSGGSGVTRQAPARTCGTARNGSPVVIYVNRPVARGDN